MKKILAFIMALSIFGTLVNAEVITNVTTALGSLTVTADIELGAENAYAPVSINVISNSTRRTIYYDAGLADEFGNYRFEFVNTGASGSYRVYFSCPQISFSKSVALNGFKGQQYYKDYIDEINDNLQNPQLLQEKLEAYLGIVEWDLSKYNAIVDKSKFYKLFGSLNNRYSYFDLEKIKEDFELVERIAFDIDKNDIGDFYELYLEDKENDYFGFREAIPKGETDTILDDVRKSIREKALAETLKSDISSIDSIAEILALNILRCCVKDAEHYEDVEAALRSYAKYLKSIDTSSQYFIDACKSIMGENYNTYQEIENAYKDAISKAGKKNKKPGGGSSGGGGGGSYSTRVTVNVKEPDKVEDTTAIGNESISTNDLNAVSDTDNTPKMYFSDMEDSKWALEAVNALYKRGVVAGMGDGTFAPHKAVSRAELSQMAVKLAGYSAKTNHSFNDVFNSDWFYGAVNAAADNGIFVGNADGSFSPNKEITREQIALVIYRMISSKVNFDSFETGDFADDDSIDEVYKYAVYALKSIGVINGRSEKTFCPNEYVTRVEAAVLLNSICMYFN